MTKVFTGAVDLPASLIFFFSCQICSLDDVECSQPLFTLPASLVPGGNAVLCEQRRFDFMHTTPTISTQLRVVWNSHRTIDNPDNASGTG